MANSGKTTAMLIADLDHPDKAVIRAAVDALIPLAEASKEIRAILVKLLDDSPNKSRWAVAYVLAHLPEFPEAGLQTLLDALDSRDSEVRWAIALLVTRLGKTDARVRRRLVELCGSGSPSQRRMAIYCIRDSGLTDRASLQSLFRALHDPDPMVRVATVSSLKGRSDLDENGRRLILELFLNDHDVRVRNVAAITLAQLGSTCKEFLVELRKAQESDNRHLRKAASAALALLQNKRSAPSGG
jgi:HEAT repeat protein